MNERVRASLEDLPPAPPMSARQWFTYVEYAAVWETAARLPRPVARRIPDRLGSLW